MSGLILPRVTLSDASTRPSLDFVLPGLLAGSVGMIVGQGAVGKSFLALQIGLAVASGRPVASGLWPSPTPGPVTLIFGEDQPVLLQERLHWLRQHECLDAGQCCDIDERLDIRSGFGHDMRVLKKSRDGLEPGPFLDVVREAAKSQRLVILDPLAFLHDGDENDNGAATRLMQTLQAVCRDTSATIILLHHVGKGSAGGDDGRESWTAARGASALTTACRWQVNLTPPNPRQMKDYGIDDAMRGFWVQVAVVKANYGEPAESGWLHRLKGGVMKAEKMLKVAGGHGKKGGGNDDDF